MTRSFFLLVLLILMNSMAVHASENQVGDAKGAAANVEDQAVESDELAFQDPELELARQVFAAEIRFYKALPSSASGSFQLNGRTFRGDVKIETNVSSVENVVSSDDIDEITAAFTNLNLTVTLTLSRPETNMELMRCNFAGAVADTQAGSVDLEANNCNNKFTLQVPKAVTASVLMGEVSRIRQFTVKAKSKVNSAEFSFVVRR